MFYFVWLKINGREDIGLPWVWQWLIMKVYGFSKAFWQWWIVQAITWAGRCWLWTSSNAMLDSTGMFTVINQEHLQRIHLAVYWFLSVCSALQNPYRGLKLPNANLKANLAILCSSCQLSWTSESLWWYVPCSHCCGLLLGAWPDQNLPTELCSAQATSHWNTFLMKQ